MNNITKILVGSAAMVGGMCVAVKGFLNVMEGTGLIPEITPADNNLIVNVFKAVDDQKKSES